MKGKFYQLIEVEEQSFLIEVEEQSFLQCLTIK